MNNTYFVDANIIMYAAGTSHALKQPCLQILTDINEKLIYSVTSVEVVQEILHRYSSLNRRADAIKLANELIVLTNEIYPISLTDINRALQIHQQYVKLTARDSIHAATMYNQGLTHLLSADAHFDGLPGIIRIDPLNWSQYRNSFST
ncbi:MAG: type II toxin-antitoxin system VapC family toxin [Chloroflexi bacterium]|nr:type II toxin-antitoxin system VapC family toxin [Chloroflexota bacterium]